MIRHRYDWGDDHPVPKPEAEDMTQEILDRINSLSPSERKEVLSQLRNAPAVGYKRTLSRDEEVIVLADTPNGRAALQSAGVEFHDGFAASVGKTRCMIVSDETALNELREKEKVARAKQKAKASGQS